MQPDENLRAQLGEVSEAILGSYARHEQVVPIVRADFPHTERIAAIADDLMRILFPGYFAAHGQHREGLSAQLADTVRSVAARLQAEILKALRCTRDCSDSHCADTAREATIDLLRQVPAIREVLCSDIEAAYDGDPAATSNAEIILAYPCVVAISIYRLAHRLYEQHIPLVPRMMTEYAHSRTGIDIHPGARIGRRFFIDHGTGVVIGETTEIGDNVKIYQGVTLGARSFPKDASGRVVKGIKRHPGIHNNVTIYSGATILGGDVEIGEGSVIGGNVWLTHSVPPNTRVIVSLAHEIRLDENIEDYKI